MDEVLIMVLFVIAFLLCGIVGGICGIVALVRISNLQTELDRLRARFEASGALVKEKQRVPPPPIVPEKPPEPPQYQAKPLEMPAQIKPKETILPPVSPEPLPGTMPVNTPIKSAPSKGASFEFAVAIKWLARVGIVLFLIGVAYFMKYMYDMGVIGPQGRLAIGTLTGIAALVAGEVFRRRNWGILFQTATGGGLAIFYLCIFFAFQVYKLTGQATAFPLAVVVTALAVVMAVAHNALPIAILGLIGGFLSPALLSTGTNHPYALFTYIAVLDLTALGAAYFRRWRALDLFCFVGTALLYEGWHLKFYDANQMFPALLYASLFYLMFLIIPLLHNLVRKLPEGPEGLTLIAINALFSLYSFYSILYEHYRSILGFVVLGQAVLVFILFMIRARRVEKSGATGESLLIIALALTALAVPLQLRLYGIPLAWAAESVVFTYLGIRFKRVTCRLAGTAALLLAIGGLFYRLPLHTLAFIPVFNIPFGSWVAVIAAAVSIAVLLYRARAALEPGENVILMGVFLIAYALACLLVSMETWLYWMLSAAHPDKNSALAAITVLWAVIPLLTAGVIRYRMYKPWMPLALVGYGVGIMVALTRMFEINSPSSWIILNASCAPVLLYLVALAPGARWAARTGPPYAGKVCEVAGLVLLMTLVAHELDRWTHYCQLISSRLGLSIVSAVWALLALVVIWAGLATRNPVRRIAGLVIFAVTIAKVLFIDMASLERVYRIISFAASGLLLLAAAFAYQRYSHILLGDDRPEDPS